MTGLGSIGMTVIGVVMPPSGPPPPLPGGVTLPSLPTWLSLRLASDSPGRSGISGGLTDTGAHDRLNLSRLGLADTLNLTSLQALGGETLGIDVSVRLSHACAPENARQPQPEAGGGRPYPACRLGRP